MSQSLAYTTDVNFTGFFCFRWDGLFEGKGCIYEVYKDAESIKVDKADPIVLVLLYILTLLIDFNFNLIMTNAFNITYCKAKSVA